MTFKRYLSLKRIWKKSPPTHVCLAAICEWMGMKLGDNDASCSVEHEDCYYDESYYDVKEQPDALAALTKNFNRVNGGG